MKITTKNTKRAIRRHHLARLKAKRKIYWNGYASTDKINMGICVITPCRCSCWGCGNQRKYQGISLKERAAKQDFFDLCWNLS